MKTKARPMLDDAVAAAFQRALTKEMQEQGMSAETFGARSNLTDSHVRFLCKGKGGKPIVPSLATTFAAAVALDMEPARFIARVMDEIGR